MMKVKTQPPLPPRDHPSLSKMDFYCMQVCEVFTMGRQGRHGKIKVVKVKAQPDIALEIWHFASSQSVLGNYHLAFSLRIDGVPFLQSKLDTFNTIKCVS